MVAGKPDAEYHRAFLDDSRKRCKVPLPPLPVPEPPVLPNGADAVMAPLPPGIPPLEPTAKAGARGRRRVPDGGGLGGAAGGGSSAAPKPTGGMGSLNEVAAGAFGDWQLCSNCSYARRGDLSYG